MARPTKTIDRELGERLRQLRIQRGLSQENLGKMVGLSFQQIQKYEKGVNGLSVGMLQLCATSLGVTIHYFLSTNETEGFPLAVSRRKLLALMKALQLLEKDHPATFALVCEFITRLAQTKEG